VIEAYQQPEYRSVGDPPFGSFVPIWMRHPDWNGEVEGYFALTVDGEKSFFWSTGGSLLGRVVPTQWRAREVVR
jgi:hypothetical protein